MAHDEAFTFFLKHGGYCQTPTETKSQARRRCARELRDAEQYAKDQGWDVRWEDDWDVDHRKEFDCYEDGGPQTCEYAQLVTEDGEVLASLGCIDDATNEYRRVIGAELASQAMAEVLARDKGPFAHD